MKKQVKKTPREARTFNQICEIPRDNVSISDHWFLITDATVTLAQQKNGEDPTGKVTIPRWKFDRIIDWYNTGQWGRKV